MRIVALFFISFSFFTTVFSQSDKVQINQTERLDKYKPSVYITFEKFSKNTADSTQQILLRLHNNTNWQISLRGNGKDKNTDIFNIPYLVRTAKAQNSDIIFVGKRQNEVGAIWRVETGKSILFSVDKAHLTEGKLIMVNFSYEWENAGISGGDNSIFHQALFNGDDLPQTKQR